jgi:hypothetical protein
MDASTYLQAFITVGGAIMGIWGFIKVVKDIKHDSDAEHDRRQRWDKAAKVIEEKEDLWDKALTDMEQGRKRICDRYDGRLDDQDAKNQQMLAMLCMTLRAQDAILEALVEQGIGNGEIKAMHRELKGFILDQVQ